MQKLVQYLLRQKLAVNLLVLLLLAGGIASLKKLNREAYPEVNFDMVSIVTIYPGGSPAEMESLVTIPIEKKLREVDGIDKVRSYNVENASSVVVFIDDSETDKPRVVQDIKDAVDAVTGLPDQAERPEVMEIKIDKTPLVDVGIRAKNGKVDYRSLKEVSDLLEDYLYEIDGVADVELHGDREREFQVEVEHED